MTVAKVKRIPEWFVAHYSDELADWARNMRAINEGNARDGLPPNTKRIVLREGVFADACPDPEMGPVLRRVTLHMKVMQIEGKMVGGVWKHVAAEVLITPWSEEDEQLIAQHCAKMQRLGVDPVKKLIEPPRAGIPFMPQRLWVPPGQEVH